MIKFIVIIDSATIAVRYDPKKKELVIGGYSRFMEIMGFIIEQVLEKEIPKVSWTQSNKVRYTFKINKFGKVKEMLEELGGQGATVVEVKSLERIMR